MADTAESAFNDALDQIAACQARADTRVAQLRQLFQRLDGATRLSLSDESLAALHDAAREARLAKAHLSAAVADLRRTIRLMRA